MPTPKRGARLAGGPAQQKAMLRNQATDLFRHGRIRTTHARAKFLRPYAERLITKAKTGDLHKRRQVLAELHDRDVVKHLFDEVAPRFASRPGGYTRIIKLGPRPGDNAPMALIELVDRGTGSAEETIEESRQRRSRGLFGRRRRRAAEEADTADTTTDVADHDDSPDPADGDDDAVVIDRDDRDDNDRARGDGSDGSDDVRSDVKE